MTESGIQRSLNGHVPANHLLSPRRALKSFPPLTGALIDYEPASLWEQDTATLPEALRQLRRDVRGFATQELRPRSLAGDVDSDNAQTRQTVLRRAAEAGMLFNHIPRPLGSGSSELLDHSAQWSAALKAEELCAACGGWGLMLSAHALGMVPLLLAGDKGALKRFLVPAQQQAARGER